ncbi:hypothetical protein R5R35_012325 [Gryllus longicercus]|uniref:Protein FAM89A n=1 Tax=Gryllus longicercus TaxID=2509291 RepID=A0AAN9V6V3_9ORTH
MASLQGLPPLPKSLSGVSIVDHSSEFVVPSGPISSAGSTRNAHGLTFRTSARSSSANISSMPPPHVMRNITPSVDMPPHVYPRIRKNMGLDAQLAILRKEMLGLRELDLSLLSQLWSLNESIHELRQLLQEQEESAALSPPSPSSADEGEEFFSPLPVRYHGVMPPGSLSAVPEQYHLSSSSSQSSIEYGNV